MRAEPIAKPVSVWRVATGDDGVFWPQCRDRGYVAVGWSDVPDFRDFRSFEGLNDFLMNRGGRGQRGARFIWRFVWEMQAGDIVVANSGQRRLLGLGKVTGEYLAPDDPSNRMSDTGFPHARRVEWISVRPITFEPHFFGWHPVTIEPLEAPAWRRIRTRFVQEAEGDAGARRDLRALDSPRLEQARLVGPPLDPEAGSIEGAVAWSLRRHYERDAQLRDRKIRQVLAAKGQLVCEVAGCGFDFAEVYGDLGHGFAHVHHDEQLSKRGAPSRTDPKRLRIVCANCHAMIHRRSACRPIRGLIPPAHSARVRRTTSRTR